MGAGIPDLRVRLWRITSGVPEPALHYYAGTDSIFKVEVDYYYLKECDWQRALTSARRRRGQQFFAGGDSGSTLQKSDQPGCGSAD